MSAAEQAMQSTLRLNFNRQLQTILTDNCGTLQSTISEMTSQPFQNRLDSAAMREHGFDRLFAAHLVLVLANVRAAIIDRPKDHRRVPHRSATTAIVPGRVALRFGGTEALLRASHDVQMTKQAKQA